MLTHPRSTLPAASHSFTLNRTAAAPTAGPRTLKTGHVAAWRWATPLLAAAVLAACSEAPAPQAPAATEVGVVTLTAQSVALQTELPGRTVAAQHAEIRPQVTGLIQKRLFTEGSVVKAGQALYQIDPAGYRVSVNSARASVARAQATLQSAELTAKRQQTLLDADAGSRQDTEDAQAALRQARADLQSAQASLAAAQLDLQRTRITAPIGGRVDTSSVTAGALVTANQTTALTTVRQTDPMWVNLTQSSADLLRLRQQLAAGALQGGTVQVQLKLEDGSTYAHPGQLRVNGSTVDESTGAVTLRAQVPNPEGLLMPGMFVRAVVQQAVATDAVLAPQAGVQRGAGGVAQAWVIDAAGKAQQKSVELAEAIGTNWRVLSGLSAGDRLVVEGTGKLRAGQLVHAVAVADGQGTDGAAPAAGSAAQADAPTPAAQGTTPAAGQPKATGATATRQVAEGPATVTRR